MNWFLDGLRALFSDMGWKDGRVRAHLVFIASGGVHLLCNEWLEGHEYT